MNAIAFGKHKGKQFSEIPTSYLHWAVDQIEDKTKELPFPQSPMFLQEMQKDKMGERPHIGRLCQCERCYQDPEDYLGGGEWG